jgi:hypothetical protein
MIRPLRRRHRRIWLVLAWLVPLVYGLALFRRPATPKEQSLPATQLYDLLEDRPRAEPGVREGAR